MYPYFGVLFHYRFLFARGGVVVDHFLASDTHLLKSPNNMEQGRRGVGGDG